MQLDQVRREIEHMRTQVHRQRGETRQLERAGISTASAEPLLEKMLNKIDALCAERDRLKREQTPLRQHIAASNESEAPGICSLLHRSGAPCLRTVSKDD
jgi:septal ring factor EnvC (AmiA/AmiB activator)